MSAPRSRKPRNSTAPSTVPIQERRIAVFGIMGIIGLTAFLIWAMRPGNFNPGTGGLVYRQPRMAWLFAASVAGIVISVRIVRRPDAKFKNPKQSLLLMIGGVLLGAVAVVILWATAFTGILRHTTPPATFAPTPTTPITQPPKTASTKASASTTTKAGDTTTTNQQTTTSSGTAPVTPTTPPAKPTSST